MVIPPSPWDDLFFASKIKVTCATGMCNNWLTASLHHIGTAVHVSMAQALNVALASKPNINLLGPLNTGDVDIESIRVRKTIYFPDPLVGILLEHDLTPVEA